MKSGTLRKILAVVCNLANVLLVFYSVLCFFIATGDGNMAVAGTRCFRYFTIDSNIVAAISSAVILPFLFRKETPDWVTVLKFIGTVAVTVTFLTVVFFLGPTQGYGLMFAGNNLFLHLICPLLCLISLLLPEGDRPLPSLSRWLGASTVLIYGCLYLVMVIIVPQKWRWPDFYGFNMGGFWYISFPAMLLFGLGLSFGIAFLQVRMTRLAQRDKAQE